MVIDKLQGRAFILMTVGCLLSVILSALVRRLDLSLSPISIAFYRSLLGLILLMPAMLKTPAKAWGVAKIRFYLLRGTLSAIATLSLFYGLKGVPLAAATALGYTGPIIGAFLVPMLLPHARLSAGHWASIIVGFIGVLIVTHP